MRGGADNGQEWAGEQELAQVGGGKSSASGAISVSGSGHVTT